MRLAFSTCFRGEIADLARLGWEWGANRGFIAYLTGGAELAINDGAGGFALFQYSPAVNDESTSA